MKSSLTDLERETGINYNDGDNFAIVYTANVALKTKLDKFCIKYPKEFIHIVLVGDNDGIKSYKVLKKRVSINAPKQFSDEHKKQMKEQGKTLGKSMIAISKKKASLNKKQKEV